MPKPITRKATVPSTHWHIKLVNSKTGEYVAPYSWIVCVPVDIPFESWKLACQIIRKEGMLPDVFVIEGGNLHPDFELTPEVVEWEGKQHNVARLF